MDVAQTSPSFSPPAVPGGQWYQCADCQKSFTRLDHLARHVRSHARGASYKCSVCLKSFSRPDLVKRHAASHGPNGDKDGVSQETDSGANYSGRVSRACKSCALAKLKCQEEKPCRRCVQKGMACESSGLRRRDSWQPERGNSTNAGLLSDHLFSDGIVREDSPSPSANNPSNGHKRRRTEMNECQPTSPPDPTHTGVARSENIVSLNGTDLHHANNSTNPTILLSLDTDSSGILNIDDDVYFSSWQGSTMPVPARLEPLGDNLFPGEGGDTTVLTSAFDPIPLPSDLDTGFLDVPTNATKTTLPGQGTPLSIERELVTKDEGDQKFQRLFVLSSEAFKRSALSGFKPTHEHNRSAEQGKLFISDEDANSPELRAEPSVNIAPEKLSSRSRDQILAMVLKTCQPANVFRAASIFPTTEMLDLLLQTFLEFILDQNDCLIHVPSFRTNSQPPELLSSLIAAGAMESHLPSVRDFGLALQEAVRMALEDRFEGDNTCIRDLQLLQAYGVQCYIAFFSGNPRKSEIAEALQQHLITLLRRGRRFSRSSYTPVEISSGDPDNAVNQKWEQWIQQESFKRLVFHVFLLDAQSSIVNQLNPLISYSELSFPLPHHRDLWVAPSPSEWRRIYLSKFPSGRPIRTPSLYEVSLDWSLTSLYLECIDMRLTAFANLHHFWGLFWDSNRLGNWTNALQGNFVTAMRTMRNEELCRWLTHFRMCAKDWPIAPAHEVTFLTELLSLYLHIPLEYLKLFSTIEELEDTQQIFDSARQWVKSRLSRQAVWHAGQALQAAKSFPYNLLKDFYGAALYHVGLVLWLYGIAWKANETKAGLNLSTNQTPTLWLDDNETAEVQKFIAFGKGTAALRGIDPQPVLLGNIAAMADLVMSILQGNFTDQPPLLVRNLLHLMKDLGSVARDV